MSEEFIRILVISHAGLGFIALTVGAVALSTRKGRKTHKLSGRVFAVSMLLCSILSVIIASQQGHYNVFLFCVGILTIYLVATGYRCLKYRDQRKSLWLDFSLTLVMLIFSFILLAYVPIIKGKINVLFTIFGLLGLSLTIQDLFAYRNRQKLSENVLKMHIGKISGAYIASVTAFVVVNSLIPGVYGWILPGILGSFYIVYWNKRLKANSL